MMETGLRTYMWHFFASEQPPVQQCANDTTLTILKGVLKMRGLTMEQNLERIRYMTAWVPLFPSCASLRKLSLLSLSFLMWNLSIKIPISQHCCKSFHVTGIWQNVEPGGLQSMGSPRVRHNWGTSLSLFTFMHWRRKWQSTPMFLPGESQGLGSLVGFCLWGRTELDMTEAT